jgi:hypothetical protein
MLNQSDEFGTFEVIPIIKTDVKSIGAGKMQYIFLY